MALRWRIEGELPNRSKLVVIAAPHTSNWDFVVGIAARFALGIDVSWLGKHTLFRGPWSVILRRWGGIPINRTASHDTVSHIVEQFRERQTFILALAPEGTRKKVSEWRTGFWYIAHGAGVPIVPVAFDWARRRIVIRSTFETTADVTADVEALRRSYEGMGGRRGAVLPLPCANALTDRSPAFCLRAWRTASPATGGRTRGRE
jgi:1-acyl-sn-glycerol-3-phosphate acyltransferase